MKMHVGRHAIVFITVLAITLGLAPAVPGQAHVGNSQAVGGRGTATIDGHLSSGEWVNAGAVDLAVKIGGGQTTRGRVLIQNDDQNLYFALWVDVRDIPSSVIFSSFVVEFDNDHSGGTRDEGDDVFVANPPGDFFDDYRTYLPPCPANALCGLLDTDGDGTSDGRVVTIRTADEVVYEISKPLDSADDAHDFSLHAGDIVGFWLDLVVFTPTEFLETPYPTSGPSPSLMADLRIVGADTTAPAISSSISPMPNASGWNNGPTTISWIVSDPESGIATSSGCGPTTVSNDTAATTSTCTATNGAGLSAKATATVRLDVTAPVITFDGNAGTYQIDEIVEIHCIASDALSGLATPSDCGSISGPAYTFPFGPSTYLRSATDRASNTTSASTTIRVAVTSASLCVLTTSFVSKHVIANSLCKKLEAGSYNAYVSELEAQTGKAISPHDAEILSALVTRL
jgi:hypothetical protein